MIFKKFKKLSVLLVAMLSLSACETQTLNIADDVMKRITMPVFLIKRNIPVDEIPVMAFERIHDPYRVVQVYFDDSPVVLDQPFTDDRGPDLYFAGGDVNPMAARLAAQDKSTNVVYLTTPCYTMSSSVILNDVKLRCVKKHYTDGPVSQAVIDTYMKALDNVRRYHGVDAFVLNGYGSGAAVATILAAKRMDVEALRTVSSRLDTANYPDLKANAYSANGLNPVDYAKTLSYLPQYHFIGQEDYADAVKVYHNYARAVGPSWCMRHSLIPDADYTDGWVEQWSALRDLPMDCRAAQENAGMEPVVDLTPVPFNPDTLDIMDDRHGRGKK